MEAVKEPKYFDDRFFLAKEQASQDCPWLADYKKGIEFFFAGNNAEAIILFRKIANASNPPPMVYVWLYSLLEEATEKAACLKALNESFEALQDLAGCLPLDKTAPVIQTDSVFQDQAEAETKAEVEAMARAEASARIWALIELGTTSAALLNSGFLPAPEVQQPERISKLVTGIADAQNALGFCCQHGILVRRSDVDTLRFYQPAADQGYVVAQYNLARYYEEKYLLSKNATDLSESLRYYQFVAQRGISTPTEEEIKVPFLLRKQAVRQRQLKQIRLEKTKIVGRWLFNVFGLFPLFLAVSSAAVASYLNPIWFAEFAPVFTAIAIMASFVSILGIVIWAVGTLISLADLIGTDQASSDSDQQFSFLDYLRQHQMPKSKIGNAWHASLTITAILYSFVLFIIILGSDVMVPMLDAMSASLLTGLTALVGVPGFEFLTPLMNTTVTYAIAVMSLLLSPMIICNVVERVIEVFASNDPLTVDKQQDNREEDGKVLPERGVSSRCENINEVVSVPYTAPVLNGASNAKEGAVLDQILGAVYK